MALIGNYSLLNRTAYRQFNTGISSQYFVCFNPSGSLRNRLYGGYNQKSASFIGYLHPVAYVLPMKPGAMGSLVLASGNISKLNTEMYAGRNLEGSATETLTLTNAQLDQIVALVADGILQIIQTNAGMAAAVGLDALGLLNLQNISAQLGGVFGVSASGNLTINSNAFLGALASMIAEAGGSTPLSPEGLAEAVWNYLTANPTTVGSMKEVIENLTGGGGSSDWTATEKSQIRNRLGIDGTNILPITEPTLASALELGKVKKNTNLIPAAL